MQQSEKMVKFNDGDNMHREEATATFHNQTDMVEYSHT